MVTSLLADAAQGGGLPKWPVANLEAAQLNGDAADPFIASAYAFGARGFDVPRALADMVRGATDPAVTTDGPLRAPGPGPVPGQGVGGRPAPTTSPPPLHGGRVRDPGVRHRRLRHLAAGPGRGDSARPDVPGAGPELAVPGEPRHRLPRGAARQRDFPPGPAFPTLTDAGHRPGRVRGGQRHPVHLEGPPGPGGLFAASAERRRRGQTQHLLHELNAGRKQPYDWAGDDPRLVPPGSTTTPGARGGPRPSSEGSPPPCTGRRPTGSRATTTWGRCPRGTCGRPWASTLRHRAGRARPRQPAVPPHHHHPRERPRHRHHARPPRPPPPTSRARRPWARPQCRRGCPATPGTARPRPRTPAPGCPPPSSATGARARLHPGRRARRRLGGRRPPTHPPRSAGRLSGRPCVD